MSISKLNQGENDAEELPNSALQHLDTPDTSAGFNSGFFNALELSSECGPALHGSSRTTAAVNKKPSPSLQNVSFDTPLEQEREALFHSAIIPKMWLSDLKKISQHVERKRREGRVTVPVRVAILDTGLNRDLPVFKENSGLLESVTEVKDFVEPSTPTMTDAFGHGTFMARLIMECAPSARILVARVAENTKELKNSQGNIKKAILWAGQTGKADIISISFGFPNDDPGICDAIETVQKERKGNIIFLASAGNSPTDDESFPARHSSVISVYATNCYGTFLESNSASTSNGAAVLGTYGDDIPDSIREEFRTTYPTVCEPGSSVATAIMAGISATMLAYASVLPSLVPLQVGAASTVNNVLRHLWTAKGMEAVLYRLVQEDYNRPRLKTVKPMWFWKNKRDDTMRCFSICDALSDVDRRVPRLKAITEDGCAFGKQSALPDEVHEAIEVRLDDSDRSVRRTVLANVTWQAGPEPLLQSQGFSEAAPALTKLKADLVAVWLGRTDFGIFPNTRLYWSRLSRERDGTPTRGQIHEVHPDAHSQERPAVAALAGILVASWKSVNHETLYFSTLHPDSPGWGNPTPIPGAGSSTGPALAPWEMNGLTRVYALWKGRRDDNTAYLAWYDGECWEGPIHLPFVETDANVSITCRSGEIFVSWKDLRTERIKWMRLEKDGSELLEEPQELGRSVESNLGPALAEVRGNIYVAWKGKGQSADVRLMSWSGEVNRFRPVQLVPNSNTDRAPSLIGWDDWLVLAWKGTDFDKSMWWKYGRLG